MHYNTTTARLRVTRAETVGVRHSGASSFIAPLKVNREHPNGPAMLIKAPRFYAFTRGPLPSRYFSPLFLGAARP